MIDEAKLRRRGLLSVVQDVARRHGMTLAEIGSDSRDIAVATARRAAYMALSDQGLSSSSIGSIFRRHHTTVLAGIRRTRRGRNPRLGNPVCPHCAASIIWRDPDASGTASSYAMGKCECQGRVWELRVRQERQKIDGQ